MGVETHLLGVETHFERVETRKSVLRPIFLAGLVASLFLDSTGGGAWPFLSGEVICLVNPVNDRELSLLNSVQHDSYLTISYKDFV